MNVKGMNILVTGGASGMGRAFVLNLAKDGANVAFCDVNEAGIADTQAAAAEFGTTVVGFKANVADEAEVTALVKSAADALGSLNGLINNAGIFRDGLIVKVDRETGAVIKFPLSKWNDVVAVDLTGPFLLTREFAAQVIERKPGPSVVVNISSVARHGNRGQGNYSAAKAGLVADTRVWSLELAPFGIRTGAIAPGFVDTPILQGMKPEAFEAMIKPVPLRRVGKPEEIYAGVRFIIECDYFTGRCIDIDGGLTV
ncbi:MAG: SDR family oxidoreductase [Myxococcales bacterium]|nr:SDR family oxidoreductase [Myxococcales bacterium]